jgi:hypothetical protein
MIVFENIQHFTILECIFSIINVLLIVSCIFICGMLENDILKKVKKRGERAENLTSEQLSIHDRTKKKN